MKIILYFLQLYIFASLSFLVFSAGAGNKNIVIFSKKIAPEKERLPDVELKKILQNLQFNGTTLTQFELIENRAKTHYIPMEIILWLKKASLLNPEDLTPKQIMQELGYDIKELSDKEATSLVSHVMDPNRSPYRELFRSYAIRTLGMIGQSQELHMYVVINYLRNLMFEMKNPNIRLHVVTAFADTAALHPLTPKLMQKLALWMKELREQNLNIKKLHFEYQRLQTEELVNEKSPQQFVKENGLPPAYLGSQDEDKKIYKLLEQIARREPLPPEVTNELVLALDTEELPRFTLMDPLLDALIVVARNQIFPLKAVQHLEKIKSNTKYIEYAGQINSILEASKRKQCWADFRS